MIDSHCHLADTAYADDLEDVVHRAREAGVSGGLCILAYGGASEAAQATRVRALWPGLGFAIGVHPHQAHEFAGREAQVDAAMRVSLSDTPGVCAIGEIGLDYHYDFSPRDVQREVFRSQIGLARETGLPVVVHAREADEDTVRIIREEGAGEVRGVFHCFSGTSKLAAQALELGFLLSFSGMVTFPKAESIRAIAASVPADRLLVETDCPYLAPVPMRGRRNEPAWVVRTVERLAEVRGVEIGELDASVTGNFARMIGA
ncbi:MAG TPA: TatD family hydrolase [Vicinamibacterales bacterium]